MTKIYVDGFKVDDIDTPSFEADLRLVALTDKAKEAIGDKKISTIQSAPLVDPKFIMIYTEL